MNIKRKVLSGFSKISDDELLVRGATVLQALSGNPNFPDPVPELEDVSQVWREYQDKLASARRKGSPLETADKNVSRELLAEQLRQLAFYVNKVADGDLRILLSSGFPLSAYPTAGVVPDVVQHIELREGRQSGQMKIEFRAQRNVLLYEYRYASRRDAEGNLDWSDVFTSSSSRGILVEGLDALQRYYVQVRAVNTYGKSTWSDPVAYIIR